MLHSIWLLIVILANLFTPGCPLGSVGINFAPHTPAPAAIALIDQAGLIATSVRTQGVPGAHAEVQQRQQQTLGQNYVLESLSTTYPASDGQTWSSAVQIHRLPARDRGPSGRGHTAQSAEFVNLSASTLAKLRASPLINHIEPPPQWLVILSLLWRTYQNFALPLILR